MNNPVILSLSILGTLLLMLALIGPWALLVTTPLFVIAWWVVMGSNENN